LFTITIRPWEEKLTVLFSVKFRRQRLNRIMIALSDPYQWIYAMLILVILMFYINWQAALMVLLIGGLGAGTADTLNTRFIKPASNRIRPCKSIPAITSLGAMNHGRRSFPSNHASNTMAFCLAVGLFYPGLFWILIPSVILVGISRIYCGAHYPLDVISGWIHGGIWTLLFYFVLNPVI